MRSEEIIQSVNELNLRCPNCNGNVSIREIHAGKIYFDHYLYAPGQKIPANEARCKFFENDIRKAAELHMDSAFDFREALLDLLYPKK